MDAGVMGAYESRAQVRLGVREGISEGRTFRLRVNNKKLRAAGKARGKAGKITGRQYSRQHP